MRRRRSRQSGSLLIEFAGSLIVLSTLITGIFQVGYAFYSYEALVNSVRAGARYASLAAGPEAEASIRNLVVFGEMKPGPGAKPVVAGLKPESVAVIFEPRAATVAIRGFDIDCLFTKVRLDGRPTVTFPRAPGAAQ